jgi:hypothetical protein
MLRGKTESGFMFEIDEEILDDYDFLELLCQIDEGDTSLTTKMVDTLLGKEQKEKLKDHVRTESGRVSAKRLLAEVMEIFNATKEGKNC